MNPWNLITKYRIQRCCKLCRQWNVREIGGQYALVTTLSSWDDALDNVVRRQTRQYYGLTGGAR